MSIPILEVESLQYTYPDGTVALKDVSFAVHAGERIAILGRNGAGKTTLLLHLIGLLEQDGGEVRVGGVTLTPDTVRDIRAKIGFVFQDPNDQLFMTTVGQDVAFGPANYGLSGEALDVRVTEALNTVGLKGFGNRAPHHLSVGERRRAALATTLAMEPEILVLDEPSASLDPEGRMNLAETLRGLGRTIIMATHDLPYAGELCDRSIVMSDGRIVHDGPIVEVLSNPDELAEHHLFLPQGFGPALARRAEVAAKVLS